MLDFTQVALEKLVSAIIPSDVSAERYLATDHQTHTLEFDYLKIMSGSLVVIERDNDGLPCLATCEVQAVLTTSPKQAELYFDRMQGEALKLSRQYAAEVIATLEEPYNSLCVYAVETDFAGIEVTSQSQAEVEITFTFTILPLMVEETT